MTILAIINRNNNICENVTLDDRPISEIVLPDPYFALDLEITPAVDWILDENTNTWYQVEGTGNGGIGDVWDGTRLVEPAKS